MSKKIISLILSVLVLVTLTTGCKNGNNKEIYPEEERLLPETVAETGIKIVENGVSVYKIMLPSDTDGILTTAAKETQYFIKEATEALIPIINDNDAQFDENDKIISLGDTSVFKSSGIALPDNLGNSGYIMKRSGKTLFIDAPDSNGSLCGVYDMLGYIINLEVYAADEIDFDKKSNVDLLDFNIVFRPTIDIREIRTKPLQSDATYARRMKMYVSEGLGTWITFGHTVIDNYLPLDTYAKNHPDWYNGAQTQVCYSNEQMRKEMVEVIKSRIVNSPDGKFVMIGHMDNFDMCECDECVAARKKLGGYGGQELDFTNKIATDVDEWLHANYPGREVRYIFFAYQTSSEPPVKYDETTQKYVPINKNFEVKDNVYVLYCPIESIFSKPMTNASNAAQYEQLKGWSDAFASVGKTKNIMIWTYSIPVRSYLVPMDNFGVYGENYKTFKDLGASYVLDQSVYDTAIPCFEELKIYTQSKLMCRSDLSYNKLAEDFIKHYYGLAAPEMIKYHNFFRSYYKYLEDNKAFSGSIWTVGDEEIYWPLPIVQDMNNMLESALEDLEPLRNSDPERYEVLYSRIKREQITPIYLMFKHHMKSLTQEQKESYWYDLKKYTVKYEIVASAEGNNDVVNMVEDWRKEIFA